LTAKRMGTKIFIRGTLTLLIFSAAAARLEAASRTGTTAANFLKIPVAVIPSGMAEAYTAMSGPDSILYNPAGLGLMENAGFSGTHNRYLEEMTQEYAAVACPTRYGTIGAGFSSLSSGKFTSYDSNDQITGETGSSHQLWVLSIAGGWPRTSAKLKDKDRMLQVDGHNEVPYRLSVGASLKKITEALDKVGGRAYAMDAGAILTLPGHMKIGVSALNMGGEQRFRFESHPLPAAFRGGVSREFGAGNDIMGLTVSADAVKYSDASLASSVGVSAAVLKTFQLRAGYQSRRDIGSRVSGGFGLNFDKFMDKTGFIRGAGIDYAYLAYGDLGATHRFGFQLFW